MTKKSRFDVRDSVDGQFYFALIAANGETLMTSETYTRKDDAEDGVRAVVQAVAPSFEITDSTTKQEEDVVVDGVVDERTPPGEPADGQENPPSGMASGGTIQLPSADPTGESVPETNAADAAAPSGMNPRA